MCIYVLLCVASSSLDRLPFHFNGCHSCSTWKAEVVGFLQQINLYKPKWKSFYCPQWTVNKGLTPFLRYDWSESSSVVSWAMAPVPMVCFKLSSLFSGFHWISGTVLDLEDDRNAKCWFLTVLIFFSALAFTGFLNIKHLTILVWLFSPFLLQKYAPT